ncbi:ethanolamine utilization microcompartment protein EutL [Chryseomicrobium palamuruense]|uniref:Ethanolamine utilization microcompartment protein EutL n=1 Tax=Chryseomicrobium palamuruense TaxID=682973 RepID=A0ABV8UW30_9BACL
MTKIFGELLAMHIIPNVQDDMRQAYGLREHERSLGLFTSTIDDVGYTAADEATKKADVRVVYAKSFYAGAAHASGPLSGEFIGILAGPSPEEIRSGLDAVRQTVETDAYFEAINGDEGHTLYAKTISSCGTFLAEQAGVSEGQALAYLIAPPLEAMVGLDAALKAADVRICELFNPPSETNFGGALLTGSQSSCQAAADAFRETIERLAQQPVQY